MKIDAAIKLILIWIAFIFAFIGIAILLGGCNSAKQATKHYNKAKEKHLPTVALLSRNDWPCGKTKSDTIVNYLPGRTDTITREQLIEVDCPDTIPGKTIKVPVKVPCLCPEKRPDTLYRYITQFEKDPRDSIIYTDQINKAKKNLRKAEQGRNTWRTVAFIFIGIFLIAMIVILKKFKII